MNSGWSLAGLQSTTSIRLSLEAVLLEYDGPQVVTARDQYGDLFVGAAVDETDAGDVLRWVYSQITDLEFHALVSGATSLRDVISGGDTMYVLDQRVDGGAIVGMWRIADNAVPDEVRPALDSMMPESVRERFPVADAEPQFRIGGRSVVNSLISFADLGHTVTHIQNLWHSLAGAIFYEKKSPGERRPGDLNPSTLMVIGTQPGSFAIKVQPGDDAVFGRISREYRKLLDNSADETSLRGALAEYRNDVADRYSDYVSFLDARKLEVLAQSPKSVAYLGPKKAARVAGYIGGERKRRRPSDEPLSTVEPPFKLLGHFQGYSYVSKRFDFVAEDGTAYGGEIEESVLTSTPITRGLELSTKRLYMAELRPSRRGDRVAHTLLAFWEPTKTTAPVGKRRGGPRPK